MAYFIAVLGVLLALYGGVLMFMSGGTLASGADRDKVHRAKWRSRWGILFIGLGAVLVIIGAVVLPLVMRMSFAGAGGILLLIFMEFLAVALDAVGIVLVFMSGLVFGAPTLLDEDWLARAQRRTRYGIGLLFAGLLAQLVGVVLLIPR